MSRRPLDLCSVERFVDAQGLSSTYHFTMYSSAHHFRVMSALAYWSPIFGEAEFLPMVAFPFVKLFPNNHLICFEFVATVLRK